MTRGGRVVMMRRDSRVVAAHRHRFDVDREGNGRTTETLDDHAPHGHTIRAWRVSRGGDPSHDHEFLSDGETVNTRKRAY